ncbi:MAG: hypothetical protein ABI662_08530, partial [Dermatophilaceae bacterium]
MPVPVAPANQQPLQADSTDSMAQANAITTLVRPYRAGNLGRQATLPQIPGRAGIQENRDVDTFVVPAQLAIVCRIDGPSRSRDWLHVNHAFSRSSPTAAVAVAILLLTSCASQGTGGVSASTPTRSSRPGSAASSPASTPAAAQAAGEVNIYAGAVAGQLSATARLAKSLVYVPNTRANTVQVIDPATFTVIATYPTGREPQHVVPSWDMKTLWVNDDLGNNLVPIDPITGKPGTPVHVK